MHFDISLSDFIWTNVKIPDTLPRSTFIFSCVFVMALNPLSGEVFLKELISADICIFHCVCLLHSRLHNPC